MRSSSWIPVTLGMGLAGCSGRLNVDPRGVLDGTANDGGDGEAGSTADGGGNGGCAQQGLPPTTVSGTVYDPAGRNPLYNVIVFVPAAPLLRFPNGVTCNQCGVVESGSPLVSALTDANGRFTLQGVPTGNDVPLVIQLGKWRKQISIAHVRACADTSLTDSTTMRLPSKESEGDMPQIAIATGQCDIFECLLRKIGIDDSEFTDPSGNGRVHVFQGAGSLGGHGAAVSGSSSSAANLWKDAQQLLGYDVLINGCECEEHEEEKPQAYLDNIVAYANAGGRVINTHFQYFWLAPTIKVASETSPWTASGMWAADHDEDNGTKNETIDTSFPKGSAFAQWLTNVAASSTPGRLPITQTRYNVSSVAAPAVRWIYGTDAMTSSPAIMQLTFNTPWDVASDRQCGKVSYSDFHPIASGGGRDGAGPPQATFPQECDALPMSPQEKALEFMFFEVSSCIQDDVKAPAPPR